jgi:hypothetical protein
LQCRSRFVVGDVRFVHGLHFSGPPLITSDKERYQVLSRVIKAQPEPVAESQLTLNFQPHMHEKYGSLRECIAQGVYQRGLTNVAPSLNKAPGNLSVELSEDPSRRFSVDALEDYIAKFGDTTPIYYLISKFLQPEHKADQAAVAQMVALAAQMQALAKQAGITA